MLEYDDVMNQQREVIYSQRHKVLMNDNLKERYFLMVDKVIETGMNMYANAQVYQEEWDYDGLIEYCREELCRA